MAQDISFDIIARDKASSTFNKISRSSDSTAGKLSKFGATAAIGFTAATAAAGLFMLKVGAPYVASLNKIQVLTDSSNARMKAVAHTLEGNAMLYAKMGMTTGDAAAGVVELTKAGLSLGASMKAVNATMVLAKAGEMSVADASTLVSNTLNTFGLKAKRAGDVANYLANAANISSADVADLAEAFKYVSPLAAAAGVKVQTVNALLAELANKGINASVAGTGLRNMFLSLKSPSGAGGKAIQALGVSVFDAHGKARNFKAVLADLGNAIKKVDDKTRAADLKAIFGKTGITTAQVLLEGGVKGLNAYEKGVVKAGAAQRFANASSKGLMGTLNMLKAEMISLGQEAYRALSPVVDSALRPLALGLASLMSNGPAVQQFVGRIESLFSGVDRGGARTSAALSQFKANFASVFASVQSILTSVEGFAKAFWGRYGDLITKYGIGTLRNLLTVVRGVMNVITGIFKTVAAVLRGDWGGAWDGIKQITRGAVQILKGLVSQLWNLVRTAFQAGGRALVDLMQAAWHGVVAAVRSGIHAELSLLASLPGRIAGAIGDLSGILVNAGKSIIQGLINGVKSMIAPLTSTLHAITNLIPKHKGPESKDRKLLEPAGRAIMDGLIGGIEGKKVSLKKALAKVTEMVQTVGDKLSSLQDIKAGFLSTFQGDSIFGADLSGGGGIDALISFEQNQASKASQLLADVQKVAGMGLSKSLIAQLQSAGSSGADQLHALASGSAAQIAQLNSLDVATSSSLQAAGMYAGNYGRGGDINKDIGVTSREEALLDRLVAKLEALQHGNYTVVEIEGEQIVKAIKKRNHRKGVATAGL